jgi:hypothetical protein
VTLLSIAYVIRVSADDSRGAESGTVPTLLYRPSYNLRRAGSDRAIVAAVEEHARPAIAALG